MRKIQTLQAILDEASRITHYGDDRKNADSEKENDNKNAIKEEGEKN